MKWYILWIAVIFSVLLVGCSDRFISDSDDIDGGVQHYVDTDAPKVIESTQIVSFSCEFSTTDLALDSSPIAGRYHTLYADRDGASYEARGGGEIFEQREFTPDADFFAALQQIVAKHDFAQYNGQSYTVSGLPPDYGVRLDILYRSAESIQASDNQSCFLPLEAMEELVKLFQTA